MEVVQAPRKYSNKFNFVEFLPRSVKKIQAFSLLSLVEIWHFIRLALILACYVAFN